MERAIAIESLAIRRQDLNCADAKLLIGALNVELAAQYPEPGANHFSLDAQEVAASHGAFLIGYMSVDPVACGAVRCIESGVAEIKRMYVVPSARGRGISKMILTALEECARQLGVGRLVLETGVRQAEAIGLYLGCGFGHIAHFGEYVGSPLSVCMAKSLT